MNTQIPDPRRSTILVVDDSKVIRVALQRILQGQNSVYEASDGEQALELLQQHPDIGLVLTDLSMPGIDGQDLLLRVRDGLDGVPADLPVVIVTGQEGDEAASDEWRSLGANAVLMKPFVPARVREVVAELLPSPPPEPQPDPAAAEIDSPAVQALRDEVERLRRELMLRQQSTNERAAQKELERLRIALGVARDESTAAFQRIDEHEREVEQLRARLQELEAEPTPTDPEADALRARLRELEGENVRLDHDLVDVERQREAVQQELAQVRAEAERLRGERNQQCDRAAAAEKALTDTESRYNESQAAAAEASQRLAMRERELESAQQRIQDLRGRVRDLEQAVNGHPNQAAAASARPSVGSAPARARPAEHPPGVRGRTPLLLWRRRWFRLLFVAVLAVIATLAVALYQRGF
ncbi:response regulator [Thioalkalivibrio sp. ALJT]|uniref:response regulator n=1 Tax=Thioalkalivibrio sp. ALJT TaxID=1158146 RepID=UPI00036F07D5|nr:response regulator [Thioalkalivibrio sp. ALJT]